MSLVLKLLKDGVFQGSLGGRTRGNEIEIAETKAV
jgi:hypothetical protein